MLRLTKLALGAGAASICLIFWAPAWVHAATARALVIYSEGERPALTAQWVLPALANLLGHFDCTITTVPVQAYHAGLVEAHDAVIYLGLGAEKPLPTAFLSDIYDTNRPVCWLGADLEQVAARFSLGRYGFRLEGAVTTTAYPRVLYRAQILRRPQSPLVGITITYRTSCKVIATAEGEGESIPYAVRSGRFWYFADIPLLELSEVGSHLVLSDQLHEILGQSHSPRRTAAICISSVSAQTNPGNLRALVRCLQDERLPFAIAVIPVFKDPQRGLEVPLSRRRKIVGVVRGAQRAGAAVIANGFTHQFSGPSGEGPEFWDATRNRPPLGRTPTESARRVDQAIAQLARCGLYPIIWATPGGRASSADYAEIARRWSTTWERRLTSVMAPAPQTFSFLVERDSFGQRVIPDNLTVLRGGSADIETILEQARCQTAVSDPWLTVAISPDAPLDAARLLLSELKAMDFDLVDLRRTRHWVKSKSLEIYATDAPTPIRDLMPRGWDATMLGPGRRDLKRFEIPEGDEREKARLWPGALLITYPRGQRPREILAFEGGPEDLAQRIVVTIARGAIILAVCACLLFLVIYFRQILLARRT